MKIISLKEFDEGLKIPDDNYRPVFTYHPIIGKYITHFQADHSFTKLSRDFTEILEKGD